MGPYVFDDVLTGSTVTCAYPGLDAAAVKGLPARSACPSLFFPGCSFINYGLPLVKATYDLLRDAGRVDGVSLLCCGKILDFEPDGPVVRAAFEQQLCDHVADAGVERIVAACPNCVAALRAALARDARTASVQVVVLPQELASMGYRVDAEVVRRLVAAEASVEEADVAVCVHDSCPDRATGEFADGVRALLPEGMVREAAHVRNRSFCCGSLLRAAGKFEAGDKQARRHGEEAEEAQASAIVTACVSCAFQLSAKQDAVPVLHYLELLFDWRIDWVHASQYMKLRFLFDDVPDGQDGQRAFMGLEDAPGEASAYAAASADAAPAASGAASACAAAEAPEWSGEGEACGRD